MQEGVPGLSFENVLDDTAADNSDPFVPDGSCGENRSENRSDSFPRSPPESVDNESCHVSGSAPWHCHGNMMSLDGECRGMKAQHECSVRPYRQVWHLVLCPSMCMRI